MKNIKIYFIILSIFLGSIAMGKNLVIIPKGYLVFYSGENLYRLDLATGHSKKLFNTQRGWFGKISKVDGNRFLFLQTNNFSEISIKLFDLRDGSTEKIIKDGFAPYYNPSHSKIFFSNVPSYKEGPFLYVGNLTNSGVVNIKKITTGAVGVDDYGVVPVSKDEIVFNYAASSKQINLYNMVTNELKTLPLKNCDPLIWRSATKQLMCYNPKSEQYFLTDLSGGNTEAVEIKPNFIPVLYLPQNDQLLYTTIGFGFSPMLDPEHGKLGIYDFASGQSQILCDNLKLGTGDAAYYPSVD